MEQISQRLLLLSNSTNHGGGFLEHAGGAIADFLGSEVREVPVRSVHDAPDRLQAVLDADAIVVGGGNTFHLLKTLYDQQLVDPIRNRVRRGSPYIGWSAGANIACPTIRTTNDMPIVEPPSFTALDLVPFQINPHYTTASIPKHGGETRADRLLEFVEANPGMPALGLREGSMLRVEGTELSLLGELPACVFASGRDPVDVTREDSLQFLLG